MLKLFTDTDCDVTPEIADLYGYSLISMPYSIDGKTTYPYVDFEKFDSRAFYDTLRGGVIPNTSAISRERYYEIFEPYYKNGDDILYVHFSRNMSATFEAMDQAVAELTEKYPGSRFYEIDSKGISIAGLAIVYEVGDMVKAGRPVEEILEWAKTEVDKFATYFFADDLKFFKHSGRVSGLAATMGTLLGVRPIIYMNAEGKMTSIGKERGRAKAIDRLLAYVDELGESVTDHRILIASADVDDIAAEVEAGLRERFGDKANIITVQVNPTAGSHCGPNSLGVCFHSIHR
ncbi:MAG: DegV family protein [Clostridiales bacterium]|nr:DegV family protein [Clostridiales bacterium]